MSELPYKRRLRAWKRHIATDLMLAGYEVETYDSSPFHLSASRGRTCLKVRICFGYSTESDVLAVASAKTACRREIWQISDDGRVIVKAKISPNLK